MWKQTDVTLDKISVQLRDSHGAVYAALDNVSLAFATSEHIGILGRNGAGKTTLMRLLSGLDRATQGSLRKDSQTRLMLVLQRPEDHFTQDTVLREIGGYLRKSGDLRTGWHYMNAVGLPRKFDAMPPRSLSGGHCRLVALACALASEPDMLILDEPMAGLDAQSRRVVFTGLKALRDASKPGIIVTSHHPDDLMGLVERLWILDAGKVVYDGRWQDSSLETLDHCLSADDTSVYRWLRAQTAEGQSPLSFLYDGIDLDKLRDIYQKRSGKYL